MESLVQNLADEIAVRAKEVERLRGTRLFFAASPSSYSLNLQTLPTAPSPSPPPLLSARSSRVRPPFPFFLRRCIPRVLIHPKVPDALVALPAQDLKLVAAWRPALRARHAGRMILARPEVLDHIAELPQRHDGDFDERLGILATSSVGKARPHMDPQVVRVGRRDVRVAILLGERLHCELGKYILVESEEESKVTDVFAVRTLLHCYLNGREDLLALDSKAILYELRDEEGAFSLDVASVCGSSESMSTPLSGQSAHRCVSPGQSCRSDR